jgi:hypothetical protein
MKIPARHMKYRFGLAYAWGHILVHPITKFDRWRGSPV